MPQSNPQPLVGDPRRKANATIAAFDYQLWQTLLAWSRLKEGEVLYVEGAEDYDIVQDEAAHVTQVKASLAPLSMASEEIAKAIHDYWTLVEANPDHTIHYVFISQAGIACEKARQRDSLEPLLRVWIRGARLDNDGADIVRQILSHKACSASLAKFLSQASSDEIQSKLIRRITWQMESLNSDDCRRRVDDVLVILGEKLGVGPREAKTCSSRLYQQVMLAARDKNAAPLSRRGFLEAFEEATQPTITRVELNALRQQLAGLENAVGGSASPSSEVRGAVREWRIGPPPLAKAYAKRTLVINKLAHAVWKHSVLFLHGSTGMGKTTLANMIVRSARGDWLWWSGRGISAEEIRSSLRHLRFALAESGEKAGIVIDDLDLSPASAKQFEVEIADLAEDAVQLGLMVVVTSQKKPSQSMLALMSTEPQVLEVGAFSDDDVVETAQALECPDPNAIRTLANLLVGGCRGHPQLIHAHLLVLKSEEWAKVTPQRFVALSRESSEPAQEAASLVASLPDAQRQLIWRLSMIRCPFTRKHALRLAEFPPPAVEPGVHFDNLCGPWIESLHDGYFRVSPLLDQAGKNIMAPGTVRQLHNAISVTLWQNNLKDFEATAAFYHAWQAQDGHGLAVICAGLSFQKNDVLELLGWGMTWFLGERIANSEPLFQSNQFVSITLRIFQFRLAASVAPKIAKIVFERLEDELRSLPEDQMHSSLAATIGALPWVTSEVTVNPSTMLRCLGYLLRSENLSAEDRMSDVRRPIMKARSAISQLVPMTMAWCNDIEQLSQWVTALDAAEQNVRDEWLGIMSNEEHALHSMVERAWIHESDKDQSNWPRTIEVLKNLDALGEKYGSSIVRIASATGQAIVFFDYLNAPDKALLALQQDHLRSSDNPFILDRLARLDAAQGRHESAIETFRRALKAPGKERRENASRSGFMAAQAAVSAGQLNQLHVAYEFLQLAVNQLQVGRLWDSVIGAKADLGFVCYKLGQYSEALSLWTASLTLIQRRISKATGIQAFAVRKASGHIITWVYGNVCSDRGSPLFEPPIGFASCVNPKTEIKSLPESDWDALWVQLIALGVEFDCPVEFADALMPRLLEESHLVVRTIAWMTEVHRSLANGATSNLPEKLQSRKWRDKQLARKVV